MKLPKLWRLATSKMIKKFLSFILTGLKIYGICILLRVLNLNFISIK